MLLDSTLPTGLLTMSKTHPPQHGFLEVGAEATAQVAAWGNAQYCLLLESLSLYVSK